MVRHHTLTSAIAAIHELESKVEKLEGFVFELDKALKEARMKVQRLEQDHYDE